MQNRLRLAILVAVSFGLIAAYGIYNFLRQQRQALEAFRQTMQNVVVAATEIPAGTTIAVDMVKTIPYLKTSLPPGSFSSPQEVSGKVLQTTAVAGEPLLESRLGEKAGLTVLLTPGQRAMAVKVDEIIGVSGFIAPNDRVDVIANITPLNGDAQDGQISKIVLQNKRVLSVAQTVEGKKDGKPEIASSITLELTPQEAEKLSLVAQEGRVLLALRSSQDADIVQTRGSTKSDLLEVAAPQKGGRPAAPAKYRVEVYLGNAKSVQEF